MKTILLLLVLVAAASANWQVKANSEGALDNADYQLQSYSIHMVHSGDQYSQICNASWTGYERNSGSQGIREFTASETGASLALQALLGLWWGHLELGYQGELQQDQWTGSAILARAWIMPTTKWTPRIHIFRSPLGMYALPLSLSAFQEGITSGLAWESRSGAGDLSITYLRWRTNSVVGRTDNADLEDLPEPRQIRFGLYWLASDVNRVRMGYALGAEVSDRTTQVPTQWSPTVAYNWMPAAAPRMGASASLLLHLRILSVPYLQWNLNSSIPVFSGQRREWEKASVQDWGTAPLDVKMNFQVPWNALRTSFELQWKSTPWSEMRYWDDDAYVEWRGQIQLEYSF